VVRKHGLIPWQRASTTEFEEVSASAPEGIKGDMVHGRSPHRPGIWDFCELATSSFLLSRTFGAAFLDMVRVLSWDPEDIAK
jgi:hypothetical protein